MRKGAGDKPDPSDWTAYHRFMIEREARGDAPGYADGLLGRGWTKLR